MSERDDRLLVDDMLHAAEKIMTYTSGMSYDMFI